MNINHIYNGDAREVLKTFPDESVNCIVTSPPYYGLRDYGVTEQIGLEKTPQEYINALLEVFNECKRVLRKDGTLWVNIGDSYAGSGQGRNGDGSVGKLSDTQKSNKGTATGILRHGIGKINGLKHKDLIGIPWMLAFALRNEGWYLRQDIIWHKPNPMPESVTDRCTKSHEYIFLLSKSSTYYYDHEAILQPFTISGDWIGRAQTNSNRINEDRKDKGKMPTTGNESGANKRSVWTVTTKPLTEAHFATFPEDLIVDCIKAGCPEFVCNECGKAREKILKKTPYGQEGWAPAAKDHTGNLQGSQSMIRNGKGAAGFVDVEVLGLTDCGCNAGFSTGIVLDPFMGAGTTAMVARKLNRNYVGIELNPEYIKIAEKRLYKEIGMFL